jgi:hypothetical protein
MQPQKDADEGGVVNFKIQKPKFKENPNSKHQAGLPYGLPAVGPSFTPKLDGRPWVKAIFEQCAFFRAAVVIWLNEDDRWRIAPALCA